MKKLLAVTKKRTNVHKIFEDQPGRTSLLKFTPGFLIDHNNMLNFIRDCELRG